MKFVEVALPTPIRSTFTYKNPFSYSLVGKRVVVQFGRRTLMGLVLTESDENSSAFQLKEITEILDEQPLFSKQLLNSIKNLSDYYFHPIGEVVHVFIPNLLRKRHNTQFLKKYDDLHATHIMAEPKLVKLTNEQTQCLDSIKKLKNKEFLLFGVTSSGKTEVYKHYIKQMLQKNKSSLVMVPEIFLTPQVFGSFQKDFGEKVHVFHSGLSDLQRYKVWLRCQNGEALVVIGTRSSIFLPLKNFGAIIFDEEHDQSFKQNEGFRYDAKFLANELAPDGAKIIYSSATPSLNLLRKSAAQEIDNFHLEKRYGNFKQPKINIHAINKQQLSSGVSNLLIDEIKKTLEEGKQALILLNRRGYATVFFCDGCGWVAKSNCCDVELVYHSSDRRLKCHRCDSSWRLPPVCPECGHDHFEYKGVGTQQIEEMLQERFPEYQTIRIDRDSVSSKSKREISRETIIDDKPKIFVGTQLLAKGHDFTNLSTIIVLNLDFGFFGADLHIQEQTAQLLVQVAGRAGRRNNQSDVFLQTRLSDHPLLQKLKTGNYAQVAELMLKERKQLGLLPYINLIYLKAEDSNQDRLNEFLIGAKAHLSKDQIEVYGPFDSPIGKQAYKFRKFCIIQSENKERLLQEVKLFTEQIKEEKKNVANWVLDIDPINAS